MQTVERDSVYYDVCVCMYTSTSTLELCKQVQYYRSSRNQQVEEEYSTVQYSTVQYSTIVTRKDQ